jgi:nucleoside-diphosphate-sugar epimerase
MKKKVVIAGGTGFIGKYLVKQFEEMGYDSFVISRKGGDLQWTDLSGMVDALENILHHG